ncbi:dTDP-4-dehydrorhamnose 3,5-epimerase [Sphingopyxis sp.]|jgi:dTDP-4-dehydrorhamnose 3,5-epimerase|uniref:dTDP-4-dehydrorhamnose 3,5-epimerase n=1 Tax=Sphingopyxis sp. TaxID=1908224 RepID=UPI002E064A44|nr:dTDP-4-dehydrorhamnose 3,5-epimerase [Sphingopyxis sp.]
MLPKLLHIPRFGDERGWFSETYNARRLADAGISDRFVQDNHSHSVRAGTIRGLHFQAPPHAQAKLVRCASGAIWDVAVDIRSSSPTYGRWVGAALTAAGGEQLYVPVGFAHGFITLTDDVHVLYKASETYAPAAEGAIAWNDPELAIDWPLGTNDPLLSPKDVVAPGLSHCDVAFTYTGDPLAELEEIRL